MPHPSIDAIRNGSTPEAIRKRARLILDMALDHVEDALQAEREEGKPLPLKDLTGTIGALGRIAGVQSTEVNLSGSVGHLHLEAMLAPRPTIVASQAPAMLPEHTPNPADMQESVTHITKDSE